MRDLYRVNKRKRGNSVRFVYNTLKNKKGGTPPLQLVEKVSFFSERRPTPNPLPLRGRGLMAALARRSCLGGLRPPNPLIP